MIQGRLKYVHRVVDRFGKARHYLRIRRSEYPILGEPGSSDFLRNYHALLALHYTGRLQAKTHLNARKAERPRTWAPGNVGWVIGEYLKSKQHAELADRTRHVYRRALELMRASIGDRVLALLDTEDADIYCAQVERHRGAATADLHLHLISKLWKFSRGLPECRRKGRSNPTDDAERRYRVRSPHEPWPTWVQTKFLQAATPTLQLAFHLLLYTGQRRSDIVALNWSDFDGTKIHLIQQKTKERVSIRVHRKLLKLLEVTPRNHERMLTNRRGKPYNGDVLSREMKQTLKSIDAGRYTLHGLRKSAAVALAELGCSELEIMAVLGHKTSKMAAHYCRDANRGWLTERAIRAWEAVEALPLCPQ
jgi:integrase